MGKLDTSDIDEYLSPDISYDKLRRITDSYTITKRICTDLVLLTVLTFMLLTVFLYPILLLTIIITWKYGCVIVLLYMIWMYVDREAAETGSRKHIELTDGIRRFVRHYFPITLVKTTDIPANKNYLFCVYPHAVLCFGGACNFCNDTRAFRKLFPKLDLYFTTLPLNFYAPIFRDLLLIQGVVSPAKQCLIKMLTKKPNSGTTIGIAVGGSAEIFVTTSEEYRIVLKKRKGFVEVALKTGASLVPVFCFGENQLYIPIQTKWFANLREKMYKLTGYGFALFKGRKIFGIQTLLPRIVPLITVVGQPLDVPKIENPTIEQIDEYHRKFCDALSELFERNKERYDSMGSEARLVYL